MPVTTYGFNPADPALWNLMRLDTQANSIINAYLNGKIDAEFAFDDVSTVEFGSEFKRFTDSGAQYNNKVFYNTPTDTAIPGGDKLVVPYDTLVPYVVGDVNRVYQLIGQTRNIMSPAFLSPGSNYSIGERTIAAYLQYDLNMMAWDHRIKANAGLRYYTTDLTSAGSISTAATGLQPVSVTPTYSGVLPALNVAFFVQPDLIARFSANRDISRPALSDLAAAVPSRPRRSGAASVSATRI